MSVYIHPSRTIKLVKWNFQLLLSFPDRIIQSQAEHRNPCSRTTINKFEVTVSLATSDDHVFQVNGKFFQANFQTGEWSRRATFIVVVENVSFEAFVATLDGLSVHDKRSLARSTVSRKHSAKNS